MTSFFSSTWHTSGISYCKNNASNSTGGTKSRLSFLTDQAFAEPGYEFPGQSAVKKTPAEVQGCTDQDRIERIDLHSRKSDALSSKSTGDEDASQILIGKGLMLIVHC